jgi:hypothetical protein
VAIKSCAVLVSEWLAWRSSYRGVTTPDLANEEQTETLVASARTLMKKINVTKAIYASELLVKEAGM